MTRSKTTFASFGYGSVPLKHLEPRHRKGQNFGHACPRPATDTHCLRFK